MLYHTIQAHNLMPTLGQKLREERQRRGWTIDQLANETRINRQYFEAIEKDDIGSLPGGFFYCSFEIGRASCRVRV